MDQGKYYFGSAYLDRRVGSVDPKSKSHAIEIAQYLSSCDGGLSDAYTKWQVFPKTGSVDNQLQILDNHAGQNLE